MGNGYIKRCLSSLIIREMQLKTSMDYIISHLLKWLLSKRQEMTSVGEGVEKRKPLCSVGGSACWCSWWQKLAPLYASAKVNLADRVSGKVEDDSFIALPGKGEHSRLLFWKGMCPNLVRIVSSFPGIIQRGCEKLVNILLMGWWWSK